ncbi:hypothetical protein BU15DRAFT_26071, partial [Melanogaster broomeanus]
KPSEYLHSHCPLCFGAEDWRGNFTTMSIPDYIVCLDACFTQKCTHNPRNNPPNPTDTVFVSVHDVQVMEAFIEAKDSYRKGLSAEDALDGCKEGMKILVSVLDGCGESFLTS